MLATIQEWWAENSMDFIRNVVVALVIFFVGRWIARAIKKLVQKLLNRKKTDPMIVSFVSSMIFYGLMAFIIIAALGQLGVNTGSFIAVIGAAGLAIGLALQGSLANFAAGFLILVFRPFKTGDFIEGGGTTGVVEQIEIFTTVLCTPDNKKVIIPNAKLTGDNIINYTAKGTRRIEFLAGVSYSDDLQKVRQVLEGIAQGDNRLLADPAAMVAVKELADSSVNFILRVWVNVPDYWDVYFDITEKIKARFDEEGISIPFPQRDVHIYEHKTS